jgi:hypothetical protein
MLDAVIIIILVVPASLGEMRDAERLAMARG